MGEELKLEQKPEDKKKDEGTEVGPSANDLPLPQNSLSSQNEDLADDEDREDAESEREEGDEGGSSVPPPSAVSRKGDKEDAEPEREEGDEEGSNQPPPSAVSPELKEGNDVISKEMADAYANIADPNKSGGNDEEESNEPFDKLEDLVKKKARKERRKGRNGGNENSAGPEGGSPAGAGPEGGDPAGNEEKQDDSAKGKKDDTPEGAKKKVDELRAGQLYMAVVLARQLERGGQNPIADNKFKRFFKSSTFDSATDKITFVGGISATAGLANADYKSNPVAQAVSLVHNLVGLVKTIKSIVDKIKKFKSAGSKLDKVFGVIGLISDFASAVSKAAGIVQAIATLSGKLDDLFKSVLGYITTISNGISQIGGIVTGAQGLKTSRAKLKSMENGEQATWAEIEKEVIPKYSETGEGESPEEEEEEEEEDKTDSGKDAPAENKDKETAEKGEKPKHLSLKQKREQAKQLKQIRKERRRVANMLLKRKDVSDEHKDILIRYIAICRMREKLKSGIVLGASGLVATALGLGTSIATGVSFSGDEKAKTAGTSLGIIAGVGGSLLSLGKMGVDKSNKNQQNNEETEMVKERLWGIIHGLGDDKYGLKGISESLEADPSPEKAEEAKGVVNKYDAADKQLKGLFVDYGTVLKAGNREEFRKLLVAKL